MLMALASVFLHNTCSFQITQHPSHQGGASVHLDFSGLSIDLWIVVLELGIAKDHALLSEAGDSKEHVKEPLRGNHPLS